MRLKRIFENILFSGPRRPPNQDTHKFFITINSLSFFGISFLLFFSIKRLLERNLKLFAIDLASATVVFLLALHLRYKKNYLFSGALINSVIVVLFGYLFSSGSPGQEGALWSFIIPFFSCSMLGKNKGSLFSFLFLLFAICYFWRPIPFYEVKYSLGFIPVYLSAFFLMSVLAYIVESVQERTLAKKIEMEAKLQQGQKLDALGQLAGGVAHDFNNMLQGISGYASLLLDKQNDQNSTEARWAGEIKDIATRASDLTAKLLALGRKGRYEVSPVDFHEVISDAVKVLSLSFDRNIHLSSNLRATKYHIMGDRTQLGNMILNLALNARDATVTPGSITLETFNESEDFKGNEETPLIFSVSDTGAGMSPEIRNRLFEPFFTTKPPGQGTGLGLASVYGAVRNHRGFVWVESEVGRGSTFFVRLPTTHTRTRISMTMPEKAHVGNGGLVLVIDDEPMIRVVTEEMLSVANYRVKGVSDGVEGIEFLKTHHEEVSAVILDMIMPRMGGLECFREIKKLKPGARVVIMSGYSLEGDAQKMLDEGASAFIQKPFEGKRLLKILGDL